MYIDYLRHIAYDGYLREVFQGGVYKIAPQERISGLHIRYRDEYIDQQSLSMWNYRRTIETNFHDGSGIHIQDSSASRFPMRDVGNTRYIRPHVFSVDKKPQVEIIVDIYPEYWSDDFLELRTVAETPVVFRAAGAALAHLASGDRLVNEVERRDFGTVCVIIYSYRNCERYALTCGHVAFGRSKFKINRGFSLLNRLSRSDVYFQPVIVSLPSVGNTGPDAALIQLDLDRERKVSVGMTPGEVRTVSSMYQEEQVGFQGAARGVRTQARVAAVTVKKSIKLVRTGAIVEVGDVLMLGHSQPMYFVQTVSKPGDSGAAVRELRTEHAENGVTEQSDGRWFGMILGSDECGAYASYSEYVIQWCRDVLSDTSIDFYYST